MFKMLQSNLLLFIILFLSNLSYSKENNDLKIYKDKKPTIWLIRGIKVKTNGEFPKELLNITNIKKPVNIVRRKKYL